MSGLDAAGPVPALYSCLVLRLSCRDTSWSFEVCYYYFRTLGRPPSSWLPWPTSCPGSMDIGGTRHHWSKHAGWKSASLSAIGDYRPSGHFTSPSLWRSTLCSRTLHWKILLQRLVRCNHVYTPCLLFHYLTIRTPWHLKVPGHCPCTSSLVRFHVKAQLRIPWLIHLMEFQFYEAIVRLKN